MPTFLIAFALVFTGSIGLSTVAHAQTKNITPIFVYKNEKAADPIAVAVSADTYYFQSWDCLTNLQ